MESLYISGGSTVSTAVKLPLQLCFFCWLQKYFRFGVHDDVVNSVYHRAKHLLFVSCRGIVSRWSRWNPPGIVTRLCSIPILLHKSVNLPTSEINGHDDDQAD